MALVDGEFCPSLDYQCDRFVDDASPSCAEYARKPQCRYNTTSKRFCIDRHEWPNRDGERPRVFVSWFEAQELCQSVGKRLCQRSEWTRCLRRAETRALSVRVGALAEPVQRQSRYASRFASRTCSTRARARPSSSGSGRGM